MANEPIKLGAFIDRVWLAVSPRIAYNRRQYRFAYDALDGHRTRRKRTVRGGTGDQHLDETSLSGLREIHRDFMRNNPMVEGLLLLEVDEICGDVYPKIQALTADKVLNKELEYAWRETMIDRPCDITGRFNMCELVGMTYLAYRRDGDAFLNFHQDGIQAIEADYVGTPLGIDPRFFTVINGIAFSKTTQQFLGCYVGKPAENGHYIDPESYRKIPSQQIMHIFSPQRLSQSRGEPCLKAAIPFIDKLDRYVDATLVAANVQACFTMFVAAKDPPPSPYARGISSTGLDQDGNRLEKMEPGRIMYGNQGESAQGIGQTSPSEQFDPFVTRMLSFITRPMAIPLMMALGDYSHATFMNTRVAYQQAQARWKREQAWRIQPMASRMYRWFIDKMVREGQFKLSEDLYQHAVQVRRWPYVDPYRETQAEANELENGTGTRREFIEKRGKDYDEVLEQRAQEEKDFKPAAQPAEKTPSDKKEADDAD